MEFEGTSTMNYQKVSDITAGMICAADISNKNGQLLIPRGTPIEEKHTRLLKAWGFTEIAIVKSIELSNAHDSLTNNPPTNEQLERRFKHNRSSLPAVIEIKKILSSGDLLGDKA
jgi:hypothetical protein